MSSVLGSAHWCTPTTELKIEKFALVALKTLLKYPVMQRASIDNNSPQKDKSLFQ